MLSTLSSWKDKACEYFRTPSWQIVLADRSLNAKIFQYLDLDAIRKWRLLSKRMDGIMVQMMENSVEYCFCINSNVEENSVKKGFKIRSKTMRLRDVNKIDDLQKWLIKVNSTDVRDVELIDCRLEWPDLLRLLYNLENMETLNIISRNEQFAMLYSIEEGNEANDKKKIQEKRFQLLGEILEDIMIQGLPVDILKHNKRKLRKLTIDSRFVHYTAILLKILPLKYLGVEEFSLIIGNSDETQTDYRSVPHLFSIYPLSNFLVNNAPLLKKFFLDTCTFTKTLDRNQRIFFNEFIKSLSLMLVIKMPAITDVSLNFAFPNFDDRSRRKIKTFIKKGLVALKNIHFGPIQLQNGLEDLVLSIVPEHVNCSFEGIYMFPQTPRLLAPNNFSFSDVSFTISRDVLEPPKIAGNATQDFNFKNYLPENFNFGKGMICQMLPLMTKLHIDQNPQVVDEKRRLYIQDEEMQLILSRGTSLVSLRLRCNLKHLTDSGLTGLKQEACKNILDNFLLSSNAGVRAMNDQNALASSKSGLGLALSSMVKLEHLALYDAGETITDASSLAFYGMPAIKTILVTSPKLTFEGLEIIQNQFPGVTVEWHP